jgi:zinc ribbon protein
MIGVGVAAFALVMVVAYLVTKPFLAPETDGTRAAQLLDDRARALAQLGDLEMEFGTGKLARDEFETSRSRRLEEIALAEAAIAELEAPPEAEPTVAPSGDEDEGSSADEDVERRIAARKVALEGPTCPRCGNDIDADDGFCRSCGTPLHASDTR